jgi:hypothetical protein
MPLKSEMVVSKNVLMVKPVEGRKRIKELRETIERGYFEMAGLLHRSLEDKWYKEWGFASWDDYITQEVGYGVRKAEYLVRLWLWCVIEQKSPQLLDQLEPMGWTKATLLAGVVTNDNVEKFVKKAETMTVEAFGEDIKKKKQTKSAASFSKEEVMYRLNFTLFEEQNKTVVEAIDKAKQLGKTDKSGQALSLICLTYLSQNLNAAEAKKGFAAMMKQFEKALGYQILVAEGEKVVYKTKGFGDE